MADSPHSPSEFPALTAGLLHEIHGAALDWAAVLGFALGILPPDDGPVVLVRCRVWGRRRRLSGDGLAGVGLDRARLLLITAEDERGLLRAGLDAARCSGLSAVILETHGALPAYTLTASRQLVLAAERARVPVIVLRGDAFPRASAAHTRWRVSPAPSRIVEAEAIGPWAVTAELLRRRGGPAGRCWHLEWDEDNGQFREQGRPAASIIGAQAGPALSGDMVSLADGGGGACATSTSRAA